MAKKKSALGKVVGAKVVRKDNEKEAKKAEAEKANLVPDYKTIRIEANCHKLAHLQKYNNDLTIQDYLSAVVYLDSKGLVDWSGFDKDQFFDSYKMVKNTRKSQAKNDD